MAISASQQSLALLWQTRSLLKRSLLWRFAGGISERALRIRVQGRKSSRKSVPSRTKRSVMRLPRIVSVIILLILVRSCSLARVQVSLCYDVTTGRYFQSTVEDIKRAENKVNYELIHFMSCSLSHFYEEIGLPPTPYTDSVGWNTNNHMEVIFSTVMSTDNRPCIAIDFSKPPVADYEKNSYD